MITSTQNPKIKQVRQLLSQSKARKKQGAFVCEGIRLLEEALKIEFKSQFLLYTPDLDQRGLELVEEFKSHDVNCELTDPDLFRTTSDTNNPQGILAVFQLISLPLPKAANFVLITDQIRDPGNLGTLMRTALAAGVDAVLISPGTVDPFSPKVVRGAMGAHFHLPLTTASWPEIKNITRGLTIYLAEMDQGINLWQSDLTGPLGIIIGGEAYGAGENARQLKNKVLHIPMSVKSESINAAAAGAVLLYEVRRQRTLVNNLTS